KNLPADVGIYIVGGEADERYINLRQELGLEKTVHFWGFRTRDQLTELYKAADLFCLPTREDIWGLVVNEAMAFGLPVVTTEQCVAGMELVENGVNGCLVPIEDPDALSEGLKKILSSDLEAMGRASLQKIQGYTIENMVKVHLTLVNEKE
ncbi:MAG: glycosyltransferase family 4 protein, partial [Firmicutes bacterium]|nr:glycosyltransferase family 4 protein [Bacillota bacterium]